MLLRYSDTAYATRITAVTTYAATMYPAFCGTSGTNPSPLLPPERQRVPLHHEAHVQQREHAEGKQQRGEHAPGERRPARLQRDRLLVQRPEHVDAQVDEGQEQPSADPQHRRIAR